MTGIEKFRDRPWAGDYPTEEEMPTIVSQVWKFIDKATRNTESLRRQYTRNRLDGTTIVPTDEKLDGIIDLARTDAITITGGEADDPRMIELMERLARMHLAEEITSREIQDIITKVTLENADRRQDQQALPLWPSSIEEAA